MPKIPNPDFKNQLNCYSNKEEDKTEIELKNDGSDEDDFNL